MLASTMQFSSYERNPPPETGAYPSTPGTIRTTREAVHRGSGPREHETHRPNGRRPFPQDPTACQATPPTSERIPPRPKPGVLPTSRSSSQLVDVPPMSNHPGTRVRAVALNPTPPPRRAATGPSKQAP